MSTIVYRPVPEADYDQVADHGTLAFNSDDRSPMLAWLTRPDRLTDVRGLYVDGRLVTNLELFPLSIATGRGSVACGGIGAVATPPHERRRGYVARMLRDACDELRARGMPISMLGPFKESFYGRYGWATFGERRRYQGQPAAFASFRHAIGRFEQAGSDRIDELDAIYRAALRGRFGPLVRTASWWRLKTLANAFSGYAYRAFVWRDDQGRGRSYLIYRVVQDGEKQVLKCREIVALDPQARAQLFTFLSMYESQVDEISFFAPADAPVNLLFPDPLECSIDQLDMLRIIDLPALCAAYGFPPECSGRLTIAVRDAWIADNQGVFELEVEQGAAVCRRIGDGESAGLGCDIRVLAQLFSRALRPRTAAAFGMLDAPDRAALAFAEQLFAGLAPFLSDWF